MRRPDDEGPGSSFEERWRRWAYRPARRSAAEAAARAVETARRGPASRTVPWVFATAGALLIAGAVLTVRLGIRPGGEPAPAAAVASAPISSGTVLLWLDEETPLYMTFQPPEDSGASGGER